MFVLRMEEMKNAQEVLRHAFPHSIKVYGCLFTLLARKPYNIEVVVDSWPDYKALICKPKEKGAADREGKFNIYSVYARDEESLKRLLIAPGLIDWNAYTLLAGVDQKHIDAVKELVTLRNVPSKSLCIMHVMVLTDISQLNAPKSRPEGTMRPLTPADAELVNNTWKFGGNRSSLNSVRSYISNHPSLCMTLEGEESPVSWVVVYNHCALGIVYTRSQFRNQGYAKFLISSLAYTLHQQGYPIYCFVEEDNKASYEMFRSLGFTEEPGYRSVWFELNSH